MSLSQQGVAKALVINTSCLHAHANFVLLTPWPLNQNTFLVRWRGEGGGAELLSPQPSEHLQGPPHGHITYSGINLFMT